MARLDGKVALITGAGTGMGCATPANEAKVVIAELGAAAGEPTAQIISQAGARFASTCSAPVSAAGSASGRSSPRVVDR